MATIILIERPHKASRVDLLNKRHAVVSVTSGKQALLQAELVPPLAFILDAVSMKTAGVRIARQLKETARVVPLIHLLPDLTNKEESPADAFVIPPITARKLALAISKVTKAPKPASDDAMLVCGPYAMNLDRRLLHANGKTIPLSPKLAQLVEYFLRHPGETLERKQIMEEVWETDYLGDTRTLDVHVRWFRRALNSEPYQESPLITVRGVGYRLDLAPAVTEVEKMSALILQMQ